MTPLRSTGVGRAPTYRRPPLRAAARPLARAVYLDGERPRGSGHWTMVILRSPGSSVLGNWGVGRLEIVR